MTTTVAIVAVILAGGVLVSSLSAASQGIGGDVGGLIPSHVVAFARAIAVAEGYYKSDGVTVNAGAIPVTANNPGDLKNGDVGFGTIHGITIYQTPADGFRALYDQLLAIGQGTSDYYTPSMSLASMGTLWSGGDPQWAVNVAHVLGISTGAPVAPWVTV